MTMWTEEELKEIENYTDDREEHWITTYTGNRFDYSQPQKDNIDIEDIGHALSNNCRFNGHINQFFSVAQHSVLVCYLVTEMGGTTKERMEALLHDAPEAYLSDMPTPVKVMLPYYRVMEKRIAKVIGDVFNIDLVNLSQKVHRADRLALGLEAHTFFEEVEWIDKPDYNRVIPGITDNQGNPTSVHPSMGKQAFLNEFWNLKLKLDKENE